MRAALVGVAVLLTSALSTWLFLPTGGKGHPASRPSSAREVTETAEITAPEDPASEVAPERSEPPRRKGKAPPAAVTASAGDGPRPKRYEEAAERFTEQLAAERQDPGWTREMRGTVDEMLRRVEYQGSTLRSAACGASLCKIEVNHDSEVALYEFLQNAREVAGASDAGGMAYRDRNAEGELRTVVYVARRGEELPQVR